MINNSTNITSNHW